MKYALFLVGMMMSFSAGIYVNTLWYTFHPVARDHLAGSYYGVEIGKTKMEVLDVLFDPPSIVWLQLNGESFHINRIFDAGGEFRNISDEIWEKIDLADVWTFQRCDGLGQVQLKFEDQKLSFIEDQLFAFPK